MQNFSSSENVPASLLHFIVKEIIYLVIVVKKDTQVTKVVVVSLDNYPKTVCQNVKLLDNLGKNIALLLEAHL